MKKVSFWSIALFTVIGLSLCASPAIAGDKGDKGGKKPAAEKGDKKPAAEKKAGGDKQARCAAQKAKFAKLDKDKSGGLSLAELTPKPGKKPQDADKVAKRAEALKKMLARKDKDGNGELSVAEFTAQPQKKNKPKKEKPAKAKKEKAEAKG